MHVTFNYKAVDGGDVNYRAEAVLPRESRCTWNPAFVKEENCIFPDLKKNARERSRVTLRSCKLMRFSLKILKTFLYAEDWENPFPAFGVSPQLRYLAVVW